MNFIKAEVFRISRKKVFYFAFFVLVCFALFYCKSAEGREPETLIRESLTYGTVVIPVIFIPVYLQVWQIDFGSRFINNILVSGISRIFYYFGKLMIMYLLGSVLTLVYSLGVFGWSYCLGGAFPIHEFLPVIAAQLLLYLVVITVGLMLYIAVDSVALSTAVYLLFIILFENLIDTVMKQMHISIEKISSYMIMQNLSKAVYVSDLGKSEIDSMIVGGIILWFASVIISISILTGREYK